MTKVALISNTECGTILDSPKAIEGFTEIVPENVDALVIAGMMPRIPRVYGTRNEHFLRLLEPRIDKKYGSGVAKKINDARSGGVSYIYESGTSNGSPGKANKGVAYPEDLIEIAQFEFRPLIIKTNAPVHYVTSTNDYMNVHDVKVNLMYQFSKDTRKHLEELEFLGELRRSVLEAKKIELDKKIKELKDLEAELNPKETTELDKESVERLEHEIKNRSKEITTLETGYKSFDKYVGQIREEKEKAGFVGLTKQFRLKSDQYKQILENAIEKYYTLYNGAFNIANLYIHRHYDELIDVGGGVKFSLAYNRNTINSDTPVKNGIKRNVSRLKLNHLRGGNFPDVVMEAYSKGGFKVYVEQKPESEDPSYLVQLPPFWDTDALNTARDKFIKTWHTKMLDDPLASGAVLYEKDDKKGVVSFDFYSHELLGKIAEGENRGEKAKGKQEKMLKIEVISDLHLGSPNYLDAGCMSNYEMLEAIMKYQTENGLPDILVLGGDMMHGHHKQEIMTEHPAKTVKEYEDALDSGDKEVRREALRELLYGKLENSLSKQKRDFRLRYIDRYVNKVLEKGGDVIIVSGQHYDKTVNFAESEADEIANMINPLYSDRVHVVSGSGNGAGFHKVKGLDIFTVHQSTKGSDELDGLQKHTMGIGKKVDLAVCGDRHRGGVSYANDTAFVSAFGLQTPYTAVTSWGLSRASRGIINVYMNPDNKGYAKYEFVTDDVIGKVWNGMKSKGYDVPMFDQ